MNKYEKVKAKPHSFSAEQYNGTDSSARELRHWVGVLGDYELIIHGPTGTHQNSMLVLYDDRNNKVRVDPGDWIIRDPFQNFRVYSDQEFKQTFEAV